MYIVGVDVGTKRTGIVAVKFEPGKPLQFVKVKVVPISEVYEHLRDIIETSANNPITFLFEVPSPYGITPSTVIASASLIGSFVTYIVLENAKYSPVRPITIYPMLRQTVKFALLGTVKAKDKDIRDILLQLHHLDNKSARKLGLKADAFSALALIAAYMSSRWQPTQMTQIEKYWYDLITNSIVSTLSPSSVSYMETLFDDDFLKALQERERIKGGDSDV